MSIDPFNLRTTLSVSYNDGPHSADKETEAIEASRLVQGLAVRDGRAPAKYPGSEVPVLHQRNNQSLRMGGVPQFKPQTRKV